MKPKRKTYYSGELSRAFWKEVNAMAIEDNDILYSIAKHLQDLEDIVLKEMYRRQNKPKSPPMDAKELLRDNNITCTRCHGTGNVWLLKDDEEECPECDGTGCGMRRGCRRAQGLIHRGLRRLREVSGLRPASSGSAKPACRQSSTELTSASSRSSS